jgi:hypothetical protein
MAFCRDNRTQGEIKEMFVKRIHSVAFFVLLALAGPAVALAQEVSYRLLATNKTSTMQTELQEAAAAGYRFAGVMGGETSFGGKEVVVLMQKAPGMTGREYRLLATNKTSTMQTELQAAANAGFEFVGQTVFESAFGGKEVAVIVERDPSQPARHTFEYRLVAAQRTSTLDKEVQEAGAQGFAALAMTVGETALGGRELVVITRRRVN